MRGTAEQPGALDDVIAWRDGHIVAIDQTALPQEVRLLDKSGGRREVRKGRVVK